MSQDQCSPLTGHTVHVWVDHNRVTYYDDICGAWGVTKLAAWPEESILGGRLETEQGRRLSEAETRRVFALARSEVWRNNNIQNRRPVFMTFSGSRQSSPRSDPETVIVTIEDFRELAAQLMLDLSQIPHTAVWG